MSMSSDSFVDEELLPRAGPWRPYFAAKMGFRNHWYPAFYSKELEEGNTRTLKILGENLLRLHGMDVEETRAQLRA